MLPKTLTGTVTFQSIQKLTDVTLNCLHQASGKVKPGRQHLDIENLESIILWVAAHGKIKLRQQITALAAPAFLERTLAKKKPGTQKAAKPPRKNR
jgi:hypothetical protein